MRVDVLSQPLLQDFDVLPPEVLDLREASQRGGLCRLRSLEFSLQLVRIIRE